MTCVSGVQAQQSGIEQRARQSAAAEDSHAGSARAAKQAQRERGAAALQRSRSEASPSGRSERLPSPRTFSPSRKERRNWSPGKRDVRSALPETANCVSHCDLAKSKGCSLTHVCVWCSPNATIISPSIRCFQGGFCARSTGIYTISMVLLHVS